MSQGLDPELDAMQTLLAALAESTMTRAHACSVGWPAGTKSTSRQSRHGSPSLLKNKLRLKFERPRL